MPGARLRVLLGVQAPDGVQGGLLQALPPEAHGQAAERVQVRGARVRVREQAERAFQAAHGEPLYDFINHLIINVFSLN